MTHHRSIRSAFLVSSAVALSGRKGYAELSGALLRRVLFAASSNDEYEALNGLLDNVAFALPDAEVTKEFGSLGTLDVTLKELVCIDLSIQEAEFSHNRLSDRRVDVSVGAVLNLTCEFDYFYVYYPPLFGTIEDDGKGKMHTVNNRFDMTASFISENFNEAGPTTATITEGCNDDNPVFNVEDLDFSESISSTILNVFEGLVQGIVEDEIKARVCKEMEELGPEINGLLEEAEERLEPYSNTDDEVATDPLEAEKALIGDTADEEGVQLFNFTQSDTLVHEAVQFALDTLNDALGGIVEGELNDGTVSTGQTLGVNTLLRSFILGDDGVFELSTESVVYSNQTEFVDAKVTLTSIRVSGLDSINRFEPISVIGAHTLLSRVAWDAIRIEADIVLEARPSSNPDANVFDVPLGDPANASLKENVTVKVGLLDLDATLTFLLGLDEGSFGDQRVGSLLSTDNILPCLLSSARAAEVTQFRVYAGDVIPPTLEGLLSEGLSTLLSDVIAAAFALYKSALLEAMPNFADTVLRRMMNDHINRILLDPANADCPPHTDTTEGTVVDLRDLFLSAEDATQAGGHGTSPYGDLIPRIKGLVDDALFSPDEEGVPKLNNLLLGPLTESQSGTWGTFRREGEVFHEKIEVKIVDFQGTIELGVSDIYVKNVDSMGYPLGILDPIHAHIVNNTVTAGAGGRAIRLESKVLIAIGGERQFLRNELKLGAEITSATIAAAVLAKIKERSLTQFPLRDALNPWCWLSVMPAPNLTSYGVAIDYSENTGRSLALSELDAHIEGLKLDLECVSCTSPGFQEVTDILSTPEAARDVTDTANEVMDYLSGIFGGEFLQIQIDRALHKAESKCPHHPLFNKTIPEQYDAFEIEKYSDDSTVGFLITLVIVICCAIAVATLVTLIVRWIVRRRHRRWLKTLTGEEIYSLYREQRYEAEEWKAIDGATKSMILSQSIPPWVRWFVPIAIVINIALFLSAHLSLGATVNVVFQFADERLVVDGFFDFTMAQTAVDLWNSGAKVLAVLIFIFSIIWPYTKLILTMAMWCLPPSVASNKFRGKMLIWLDTLAKWSMIDIFVLIVALVAFRISATSPENLSFIPLNLYSVDMLIAPLWGLYSNMIAQLVSQVTSHVIIHYHRKIVAEARCRMEKEEVGTSQSDIEKVAEPPTDEASSDGAKPYEGNFEEDVLAGDSEANKEASPVPLRRYLFGRGDHKEGQTVSVARGVDYAVVALSVIASVLVIVGCTVSSFQFEILGAVGLVIEFGQDFQPALNHYSVFSIAGDLIEQARFMGSAAQYVGLGTLSAILVATSLLAPLLLVGFLLWLWFVPTIGTAMNQALLVRIEVVKAWQYVEVYIISVVLATWQVGGLSAMMVDEYCESLDRTFSSLVYYGIIKQEDGQCFYASSKVEAGTFVLMAAAVILAILEHFVTKAAAQKIHEQERHARRERLMRAKDFMSNGFDASLSSDEREFVTTARADKIAPVPVQFVDNYRW
eukprot:CAMPEP_0197435572 /NCGR_PEP_ID=MMETSP1175-20131217/3140_1 /TAXON_ID=1003142 /ORGANISM="Triceratium dubium, Strain CCMP147" /LENGTH=1492 /DNA_ID=CAMNT_0042964637 /DNA_START=260 /DNA_END=4735 /DNA_ORIENTATION=-